MLFLDPNKPIATCISESCDDCPVNTKLHCHFKAKGESRPPLTPPVPRERTGCPPATCPEPSRRGGGTEGGEWRTTDAL